MAKDASVHQNIMERTQDHMPIVLLSVFKMSKAMVCFY